VPARWGLKLRRGGELGLFGRSGDIRDKKKKKVIGPCALEQWKEGKISRRKKKRRRVKREICEK